MVDRLKVVNCEFHFKWRTCLPYKQMGVISILMFLSFSQGTDMIKDTILEINDIKKLI